MPWPPPMQSVTTPRLMPSRFIGYVYGTAVKSDRRLPERYGVLGDHMPPGYVRQQLFHFTSKG
jgi:hypothetical protein